jgi:16S rRNA (cytidine1402-2'-O)-methyltransferase
MTTHASQTSERNGQAGTLYVVATPIGNRRDLTERARDTLAQVDVIAAEDTRHSGMFLSELGIAKPMLSLHDHNESQKVATVLARLQAGESVALISDAGTPLISDPGFGLVRAVIAAGIKAVPIPGACAAIAALSVAGLPTDKFVFEGFLPAKSSARCEALTAIKHEQRTLVFYEAPHRIAETLRDMCERLGGERQVTVARELTKQFETLYHGTLTTLVAQALTDKDMQRGEIVIVVAGATEQVATTVIDATEVLRTLLEDLPASQAAKIAAKLTGAKRSELYEQAVAMSDARKKT